MVSVLHNVSNNYRSGTLLIDPYWIGFYVTNYSDHFRRRALVGSICRLLAPRGISVIAINAVAIAVLCGLILLLIKAWQRLEIGTTFLARLFTFAFFASPFIGVLWEVLGDTLQIAFLLFCGIILLAHARIKNQTVLLALGIALVCLGFFIHEASIFFLAPALPFFTKKRPGIRDFILPTALLGALLVLSAAWSHVEPHLTYSAILFPHRGQLEEPIETPDFRTLLVLEKQLDFSSKSLFAHFVFKILRVAGLAFVGLIALVTCFSRSSFDRFILAFSCVSLYCVPLFVIAHDWGRFLGYIFMLAILAAAIPFARADRHKETALSSWSHKFGVKLSTLSSVAVLQMAALFVLLEKPGQAMRTRGVSSRELLTLVVLVLFALVTLRGKSGEPDIAFDASVE